MNQDKDIFADLVVLELAAVLAGPAVGLFFAELGARVIKIENATTGGDVTRTWRAAAEAKDSIISAYYAAVNWNKETYFLDLSQQKDQDFIHQLLPVVDIVVANFKPSAAARMRVDAATLRGLKPDLIYAEITGFGQADPRVAFDVVLQAETGFMQMNGQADSEPTKMPVALIDILAAHQLKQGIMAALYRRLKTGQGARVEISLYDAAVAALANQASTYLMTGAVPQRIGSLHPNIAPYGETLRDKDGALYVLAVGADAQFSQLCQLLNLPQLPLLPEFANNPARVKNRISLLNLLQTAFEQIDAADFYVRCHKAQVPIGKVRDLGEVFAQPAAQDLVLTQTEADSSLSRRVATAVFRLD
jgi:crotonobetainyl-CoA:carnitine CoA-transferase CaiB-like acyl-CoA transferase